MYRVIRIRDDGFDILTKKTHYNGWNNEPVFTANPGDRNIIEYSTRAGALKSMARLKRDGYETLVIDSSTGTEIDESLIARGQKVSG